MNASSALGLALLFIQAGITLAGDSTDVPLNAADQLFAHGSLGAARQKYEALIKAVPSDPAIMERLGYICHLTGQYKEAVEWFDKASSLNPEKRISLLAYTVYSHYLMRDYARAGRALKAVESAGYQYKLALLGVEQLQQLAETPPQIDARVDRTVVAFEALDPLPIIQIKINSRTVHAFIDTGGPQFGVDAAFAEEEKIQRLSERISHGVAGSRQKVGFGVARSVALGDVELRNVPVIIVPLRKYSKLFGVQIDAFLDSGTLAQFLPTLDFPRKRLILRTKTPAIREEIRRMAVKAKVSFILDDIHSMYAQCRINDREPVLLYFDSGLVDDQGASILTARDQLVDLGIPVSSDSKSGYADIPRVRVGALERTNVKALYGSGKQLTCCEYIKPCGLIAHNFLKHYAWTIDFDSRVFLFDY
jgi:hypothetical protein